MRKVISFVHISLDGFVAGPNGEMNWIELDEELFDHISKRIGETDTALYGRKTYEMMEGYWPTAADKPNASKHDRDHSAWYKTAEKIVVSKTMAGADLSNTTVISDNLTESIREIKSGQGSEILLFGSPTTTHALMQDNLMDGYWLFVNPVILGQGIPLFKNIREKTGLKLVSTRQFTSGVTELSYISSL
jgi:dihydrofolate reductase